MAREQMLQGLAVRQHGLATRQQLLRLGFTGREIAGRVARGVWVRAAPRVYDVAAASFDPLRALHAATLSSTGWASHQSGAALLGYVNHPPPRPSVVIDEARRIDSLDADVHRSRNLSPSERTTVEGIPCTSAVRTLLDLGQLVTLEELDDAFGRAIVSGRITLRRVDRYLEQPMVGRRGAVALRAVADTHRDRGAATQSRLEVIVSRAVAAGWQPLRYTWPVARNDPDRVVSQIRAVIDHRRRRAA